SDRPVTIWAVGPLTNVARALDREPEIAGNIEEIVIMGGAVDVPGNVFGSPAEWNVFIDAGAAAEVISSGVPITLVALDATNDVPVPGWFPVALDQAEQSGEIVYLSKLVNSFGTATSGAYHMWDELAAAVVAEAVKVTTEAVSLMVVVGGSDNGQTARDEAGSPVTLVTGVVSPDAFYGEFISTLARSAFEKGEATAEEEAYLVTVAESLSEFGEALEASFGPGSPLNSNEFDGGVVAEALVLFFDALAATQGVVQVLDPPASMTDLHTAYLEEVASDLGLRTTIVDGLRSATTREQAIGLFGAFSDGSACEAVAAEAFSLGVEADFPCNP
ncbi:MAG: nucleoside hydrolase, partial [Actinomycetota bacterium]|nr:nucleoside hydrolase [Actinomycetota bacterium]